MTILAVLGVILILIVAFFAPRFIVGLLLGIIVCSATSNLLWIIFFPVTIIGLIIDIMFFDATASN